MLYLVLNLKIPYLKYVFIWGNEHSFSYLQSSEGGEGRRQGMQTTENTIPICTNLLYSLAYMKQTVVYFIIIEIKPQKLQK